MSDITQNFDWDIVDHPNFYCPKCERVVIGSKWIGQRQNWCLDCIDEGLANIEMSVCPTEGMPAFDRLRYLLKAAWKEFDEINDAIEDCRISLREYEDRGAAALEEFDDIVDGIPI